MAGRIARMLGAVVAVSLILGAKSGSAQRPSSLSLSVPRITSAPTLDDVAAERWPQAGRVDGFRQRVPGDGTPESRRTVAFLAHDDTFLYVGFRCESDSGTLRARMAPREDIDDDDRVSLYVDTFRNQQRAWVFSANAFGVQQDAVLAEGQEADNSFDTVWQTDAERTAFGFVVLMKVPFSSLRFGGGDEQTWGLALGRTTPGLSEEVFWPYVTNRVEGFTNQMAAASLRGVVTSRNVLLVPYGVLAESRSLDASQVAYERAAERRVGVDAKAVVRSFTLDASVNPDFSQVTPDEPQVTVNQRFEVFFPERRPFFIENADYFAITDQLFFSRRVRDPRMGLRLTGRIGRWTVGALGASDRQAHVASDVLDPNGASGVGVLRVQRDFGEQSRISSFATSRRGVSGQNLVLGVDARVKLSPTWVFTGLMAGSDTRAQTDAEMDGDDAPPNGARARGSDTYGALVRSGRGFNYSLSYLDRSPTFEAQLGYVPRMNIREVEQELRYAWYPVNGWLRTIEPALSLSKNWSYGGQPLDWYVGPELNIGLFDALDVQLSRTEEAETYKGLYFRQHATSIEVQDATLSWLGVSGGYSRGRAVNFDPALGTTPSIGVGTDANIGLTWRPLHRLRIEETYYLTRLALPTTGERVFDNHVARTKALVQFSRALSVRAIIDYRTVASNASLSALSSGKRLTGDLLVTYQLDPFTAVYVGYTDQLENLAMGRRSVDTFGNALPRTRSPRTSTDRQLFVKTSLAVRF